jgi:DNA-binding CsgD family transcriptional regulator
MNPAAERIVMAEDGLGFQHGGLRAEDLRADEVLQARIRSSCNTTLGAGLSPGGVVRVQRPSGAPGYIIRVSPVSKSGTLRESHGAGAVILIDDPTARPPIRLETLQILFGFTPAESRVALALLQDKTREQVAAELGISNNTVRTHAKTVFDKSAVSSRSGLVRLLMSVAYGAN